MKNLSDIFNGDYMKKLKICEEYYLGVGKKLKMPEGITEKITVVCFENDFSEEKYYLKLLNEDYVEKVILIGAKPKTNFGKKLIITNKLFINFILTPHRIILLFIK